MEYISKVNYGKNPSSKKSRISGWKVLFASFMFILQSGLICSAAQSVNIEYNLDKNLASVSGTADSGIRYAALEILKKDKTEDDVLNSDESTLGDVIMHADQVLVGADGSFEFLFTLPPESETYDYIARISMGRVENDVLVYVSYSDFSDALGRINSEEITDATAMYEAIENAKVYLGINIREFDLLTKSEKTTIADKVLEERNMLTDKKFPDSKSFLECFTPAFIIEMVNHCKDNSSDYDGEKLIWDNQDLFCFSELDAYKTYQAQEEDVKELIIKAVCGKGDFETVEQIQNEFSFSTVNYALSEAKGYDAVSDILKQNKEFLDISLSDYNDLSSKSSVDKKMIGVLFDSKEELRDKFNSLVSAASKNSSSSSSGGGGGSKNSSSNSMSAVLDTKIPSSHAETFYDLENVLWAKESILGLLELGVVNGKGNGKFVPLDYVTREEFVKMLINILDCYDADAVCNFEDVAEGSWYFGFVASGVKHGLINGISGSLFGTGQNISRQDIAVLVYRAAAFSDITLPRVNDNAEFSDALYISEYAKEAVSAIAYAGIVNGTGSGNFEPLRGATRAEAAKILYGFLGLLQ